MANLSPQLLQYLLAAGAIGGLVGWLIRAYLSRRQQTKLADEMQLKLDDLIRQRDRLTVETGKLRSSIEDQQATLKKHEDLSATARTDLEAAHEKVAALSQDVSTLSKEREGFKDKVDIFQNALGLAQRQTEELQEEFLKSGEFYKAELVKSFDKRKALEAKLEKTKLAQESFSNLLHESRSEHDSVNRILASAKTQLAQMDTLEQNIIELEAENAQLGDDNRRAQQELEALRRDVTELNELRVQNNEMAESLRTFESDRSQHELAAKQYREQANDKAQESETLRIKLDEVEKNFAAMETQQRDALTAARSKTYAAQEEDDLQAIVGIGKVFERTLHELGIRSYRQMANFDTADIAHANGRFKDFKGRMEQDDWIGQAKKLQLEKYGTAAEV